MAALNWYIFRKNQVVCHQRVPKFELSVAIARRAFNQFWIALYQNLSWSMTI